MMGADCTGRLIGLIPAAGLGSRVRPYSELMPKSMLPINGVPNLQRIVELMRDQLGIVEIVIVTGYRAEVIEEFFDDGRALGVSIRYVRNTALHRGLAWSILLGRELIDRPFCVILSDECYVDSNHHELKDETVRGAFATCGVMEVDDVALQLHNPTPARLRTLRPLLAAVTPKEEISLHLVRDFQELHLDIPAGESREVVLPAVVPENPNGFQLTLIPRDGWIIMDLPPLSTEK